MMVKNSYEVVWLGSLILAEQGQARNLGLHRMVVSCKAILKLGQARVEDTRVNHDLAHFGFVALHPDRGLAPNLAP
jgi:hypothetical protein